MSLTTAELDAFRRDGHVTVAHVFPPGEIARAIADVEAWSETVLAGLDEAERRWYVDGGVTGRTVLRKLDNPHFHRPVFTAMARQARLVAMVESIIGSGVSVYFSQIFMKPPRGGGPKPMHQDNFYFGLNDADGMVTAWIALDTATTENGCLYFADGSHKGPVLEHVAPADRPFDLQVPPDVAATRAMTPAPVPRGGVSFHHGGTLHQSADNRSGRWRRACAMHYVRHGTRFVNPALDYDHSLVLAVT